MEAFDGPFNSTVTRRTRIDCGFFEVASGVAYMTE